MAIRTFINITHALFPVGSSYSTFRMRMTEIAGVFLVVGLFVAGDAMAGRTSLVMLVKHEKPVVIIGRRLPFLRSMTLPTLLRHIAMHGIIRLFIFVTGCTLLQFGKGNQVMFECLGFPIVKTVTLTALLRCIAMNNIHGLDRFVAGYTILYFREFVYLMLE